MNDIDAIESIFPAVERLFMIERYRGREISTKYGVPYWLVRACVIRILHEAAKNGTPIAPRRARF
jgi:hypothetical protein